MTKREAQERNHQENTLLSLGFTREEADKMRRISMTLRRWFELECGDGNEHGSWAIERGDNGDGKPFLVHHHYLHGRGKDYVSRTPISDREMGARKRLADIITARNARALAERTVCPNCDQWQHANHGDCLNECVQRGFAPSRKLSTYIQGDPRGCSLYIIRPGDVPAGADVNSYYTRGIAVA